MAELSAFEIRLRDALERYVEGGPADFDAVAFAGKVAAADRGGPRFLAILPRHQALHPAWLLLIAGLLLALAAGIALVGSHPQPFHSSYAAPPAGRLIAISHDEAWAITGDTSVSHFANGQWSLVSDGLPDGLVFSLALGPDGVPWVATATGVARLENGRWTRLLNGWANEIAFAPDGTAWIAGATGPWSLRRTGGVWVTEAHPGSPVGESGPIAVDQGNTVWKGGGKGWVNLGGLARLDGGVWQTVSPFGATPAVQVEEIVVAPDGDVWMTLQRDHPRDSKGTFVIARLGGTGWTVYGHDTGLPDGNYRLAITPDGVAWAAASGGIYRLDGRTWTVVDRGDDFAISAAPDGTVWVSGPDGPRRLGAADGPAAPAPVAPGESP